MTAKTLNRLLLSAAIASGAIIATITHNGHHVPELLDYAAAALAALTVGQHLPTPGND